MRKIPLQRKDGWSPIVARDLPHHQSSMGGSVYPLFSFRFFAFNVRSLDHLKVLFVGQGAGSRSG
jgi:hypothetical protein